ncbi:MAG: arylsulfotransferase family protein [Gammaproteobacteria bacterium]
MNRLALLLPLVALIFLSFIAGTFVIYFERYPFEHFERAYKALRAQYFVLFVTEDPRDRQWLDIRTLEPQRIASLPEDLLMHGVTIHDAALAYEGYTLYTGGPAAYPLQLVDMDGTPVHEWRLPVDLLQGPALDMPIDNPNQIQIRRVKLQTDGSLLMVVCYFLQHTPYGMGVVKLDKDSNIVWQNLNSAHHDIDITADGRVYALTQYIQNKAPDWPKTIKAPYLAETISILDHNGETIKTISILDALRQSPFEAAYQYIDGSEQRGDILHTNSIDVIEKDINTRIPGAKPGDILVSIRNSDTLVLIDPDTEKVTWAARGPWHHQHDADLLDNGNILLFDNLGNLEGRERTRILEIDPQNLAIVWRYPGDNTSDRLMSRVLGSQQRLANGNTLITESTRGRLLEVTPAGKIVWEYWLPQILINSKGGKPERAAAYSGERLGMDQLQFTFNSPR